MRRSGLAAVCCLALTLIGTTLAAAAKSRGLLPVCNAARHHIVAADAQAEVYEAHDAAFAIPAYFACLYGRHRAFELGFVPQIGSHGGYDLARLFVLTGPIIAFEHDYTEPENGEDRSRIIVRDLRTGRTLHSVYTATQSELARGPAGVLVLKPDGSVAWTTEGPEEPAQISIVHVLDKSGARPVATGTGIDSFSLALAQSTIYWTQNGTPHSATIQ